jgi:hypothetical protein
MNGLLFSNLLPCFILVFPIRDSLRPESARRVIRERQVRYEIDHGLKSKRDWV